MTPEEFKAKDLMFVHFNSVAGMEMFGAPRMANIEYIEPHYRKKTWAEKQHDKLVYKMKRSKAMINKLIVGILTFLSFIAIFALVLFLATLLNDQRTTFLLGLLGCMATLLSYLFYTFKFECDSSYVSVKHRGKKYHWLDYQ